MKAIRLVWFVVLLIAAVSGFAADGGCYKCSSSGQNCLQVATGTWGSESCSGGHTDDCGISSQCQEHTGQRVRADAPSECFACNIYGLGSPMCLALCPNYASYLEDFTWRTCAPHCHGPENTTCSPGLNDGGDGNSPVLLMFGAKWGVSDVADGVHFDLDGDGAKEIRSWPYGAIGIITQERDGKPTTTSGQDLYGDWTPNIEDRARSNGFVWMLAEDANGDRFFDARDPRFLTAKVWFDSNPRDGIEQAHESVPLASVVEWISLDYHWTGRRDRNGNEFRYQAAVKYIDGKIDQTYDVWLQTEN